LAVMLKSRENISLFCSSIREAIMSISINMKY
jgi:hypothetical protein